MLITRGKHQGKTAQVHQYANDWLSVDVDLNGDRQHLVAAIINPTSVQFDSLAEVEAMRAHTDTGTFWNTYRLDEDTLRLVRRR